MSEQKDIPEEQVHQATLTLGVVLDVPRNTNENEADYNQRNKQEYRKFCDDLTLFRIICQKLGNMRYTWECAHAKLEIIENKTPRLKPYAKEALDALRDALRHIFPQYADKKEPERNLISEIWAPHWLNSMGEAIASSSHGIIQQKWKAKDPELNASRNYLAINGVRDSVKCGRTGIPFKNTLWEFTDDGFGILTSMRRDAPLKFKLFGRPKQDGSRRLDPEQIFVLKQLGALAKKDGQKHQHWKPGTLTITKIESGKNAGQLRAFITYSRPPRQNVSLYQDRIMEVCVGERPDQFLYCSIIENKKTIIDNMRTNTASAVEAIQHMNKRAAIRERLKLRSIACGANEHARLEIRNLQEINTQKRDRDQRRWNGTWTNAILTRALAWHCGQVIVRGLPLLDKHNNPVLFGHPWKWAEFKNMLSSNCERSGIALTFEDMQDTNGLIAACAAGS